jgi:AraC family transcriptional regulator, transcriptional activator of pobA
LNIDFEEIEFSKPTLLCVFPEQVHHIIEIINPEGWIISFDASLVERELLLLIENKFSQPLFLDVANSFYQSTVIMTDLMEKLQSNYANIFTNKTIHALLNGLLNLIAVEINANQSLNKVKENRSNIITDAFRQLVKMNFKTWKKPARYASELAISVAHLNDTVKGLTESPISVHIQQVSILEAKRLLYFTDKNVKEIGYEIGYEDPVYFGKLFKKITQLTPFEFRKQFRD